MKTQENRRPSRVYQPMILRTKMVIMEEQPVPFADEGQTVGQFIDAYIADAENNGANLLSVTLVVPQED